MTPGRWLPSGKPSGPTNELRMSDRLASLLKWLHSRLKKTMTGVASASCIRPHSPPKPTAAPNGAPVGSPELFSATGQLVAVVVDDSGSDNGRTVAISRAGVRYTEVEEALQGWQTWAMITERIIDLWRSASASAAPASTKRCARRRRTHSEEVTWLPRKKSLPVSS
jgi:hypothetical protein